MFVEGYAAGSDETSNLFRRNAEARRHHVVLAREAASQ
jgi:hypothetical protein